ncbi:hypothetical protein BJ944DRAFT_236078 [Cunninghamella echinulata]|nr:hypothetical protein BJ944DRAFT_236078 [Cunninghamella echinulata]
MIEKKPTYKTNDKKRKSILSLRRFDKKIKLDNKDNNELLSNTQQQNTLSPVTEKPTSSLSSTTITTITSSSSSNTINTTDTTFINNNSNNNAIDYKNNVNIESFTSSSTTSLGEYQCPICNTDLTHIKTSYSRQTHVDQCLSEMATVNDGSDTNNNDIAQENREEDLFLDYCHFCGKDISQLLGNRKENHYDQCLNTLEKEQEMEAYIKKQEKLNTFAGQSLPFLQKLDICPSCHDIMKPKDLRSKITHIKKCIKQHHVSIQQIIQKIHWMQWDHSPSKKKALLSSSLPSSPACTLDYITSSTPNLSQPSTFSVNFIENNVSNNNKKTIIDNHHDNGNDNDFSNNILMYKIAAWKKSKAEKSLLPSEDELVAMALSRSLLPTDSSSSLSSSSLKKKNGKSDLNVSNILSNLESKNMALKALEKMINKKPLTVHNHYSYISNQIPLVVSKYSTLTSSTTTSSLWKAASK